MTFSAVMFSIGDTIGIGMTPNPLTFTPRFNVTIPSAIVADYAHMAECEG